MFILSIRLFKIVKSNIIMTFPLIDSILVFMPLNVKFLINKKSLWNDNYWSD